MIWLPWALLPVVLCAGVWLGARIAEERTRQRGEAAIRVFRDLNAHDPWIFLTATERLIRKATGLDDLEPPTERKAP